MTKNTRAWFPYLINQFKGLNLTTDTGADQGNLEDGEFTECVNFDVHPDFLKKRGGISVKSSPAFGTDRLRAIGYLYRLDDNKAHLVFNRGTGFNQGKIYHSSDAGASLVEVLSGGSSMDVTMPRLVEYNNHLYGGTYDDGVFAYNGTNMTHMTDSPNGYCGDIVQDRLFLIVPNSNSIRFSEPANFNGSSQWPATNVFTVGGPTSDARDPIVSLVGYKDRLVIFRQFSIYVLYLTGTPANWQLRKFIDGIGASSIYSTCQAEDFIYFVGHRGVYRTNLGTLEEVSTKIYNKFKNRVSLGQGPTLADTLLWSGDAIGYWNNKILVSLGTSSANRELLVYATDSDTWTTYLPNSASNAVKPWNFVRVPISYIESAGGDKIPLGLYWAGQNAGTGVPHVCFFSDSNAQLDGGLQIICSLKSKLFNMDNPFNMKKIPRCYISAAMDSTIEMDINAEVDHSTIALTTNLTGFNASAELIKVKGPGYARQLRLHFNFTNLGDILIKSFGFDIRQDIRPNQFVEKASASN